MRAMRGLLLWGLAVGGLCLPCPAHAAGTTELIANGGFEDGLNGWTADPAHTLVTDPGAARTGKACLTGEITGPNKHLTLRQRVSVKAGNRYQFEIAARGTNKTKLVLWVRRAPNARASARGRGSRRSGASTRPRCPSRPTGPSNWS